jgi:hypothetical protein
MRRCSSPASRAMPRPGTSCPGSGPGPAFHAPSGWRRVSPHAGDFDSDVQSTLFGLVDGVSVTQGAPEAR